MHDVCDHWAVRRHGWDATDPRNETFINYTNIDFYLHADTHYPLRINMVNMKTCIWIMRNMFCLVDG